MEIAILIGIQGSGKSTFAATRLGSTHVRISRDVVKTPQRERILQFACLCAEQSFAADNTHAQRASRAKLIAMGRAAGARMVAYFFPPDVGAALARNARRAEPGRVPDVAIHSTAAKLEAPGFEEGFDAIFRVRVSSTAGSVCEFEIEEQGRDG